MKLFLETIGYTLFLTLVLRCTGGNLIRAFQASVFFVGSIAFIYYTIGVYEYLKSIGFYFKDTSKEFWIRMGIVYLLIEGAFLLILPFELILWACITLPMVLIILFIYDRITTFFKG